MAGEVASEVASEVADERADERAGERAGDAASETASETVSATVSDAAGEVAGDVAVILARSFCAAVRDGGACRHGAPDAGHYYWRGTQPRAVAARQPRHPAHA
ncbi:hypothetical protein [Burkholderia sp. Nafp2/4-1b]|uniref:hypothetical protein n=1 Tax=Burkholderia sp. Nafp2/4-1b TaxID=2116686 RepID=UPI0013CEC430|nr:hypothetical protein [Burkholderia sp. Nafp2/4-1b]